MVCGCRRWCFSRARTVALGVGVSALVVLPACCLFSALFLFYCVAAVALATIHHAYKTSARSVLFFIRVLRKWST